MRPEQVAKTLGLTEMSKFSREFGDLDTVVSGQELKMIENFMPLELRHGSQFICPVCGSQIFEQDKSVTVLLPLNTKKAQS